MQINRRSFLMGSAGVATGLAFGAASTMPAFAEDAQLRAMWWGSNDRAKRTLDVAKLYQSKTPGVTIIGESLSGDGYWTKLATQMAGRSIADVFQLEPGTISDYSKRGACLPLDEFVPSTLKVDAFGKDVLKLTTVDGKLYGIGLGLNSFALFFDQTAFEKAGIPLPTPDLTWDEYAKLAVELTKAGGKDNYWGGPYGARYTYVFDAWLRQRGKSLYDNGTLGFDVEDANEWYSFWEELRKKGGARQVGDGHGLFQPARRLPADLEEQAGHHHVAAREEGRSLGALLSPSTHLERWRDDEERRSRRKVHRLLRQ
jgi:multiple sugar transport system substrate-binding protein